MGKNAKTTEFLKECMSDALVLLMKKKPVEKITAQEITDCAGVGRATWFRNFQSKSDALSFKLVKLWERWIDTHYPSGISMTKATSYDFFHFNYSIRDLLDTIYEAGMQSSIYDAFYIIMTPRFDADIKYRYESRFFANGLFGLLDEWVKRKYLESPDEMAALFSDVFALNTNVTL